jgi:hypothetical protein
VLPMRALQPMQSVLQVRLTCASAIQRLTSGFSQVHEIHPSHVFLEVRDVKARSKSDSDSAGEAIPVADVGEGICEFRGPVFRPALTSPRPARSAPPPRRSVCAVCASAARTCSRMLNLWHSQLHAGHCGCPIPLRHMRRHRYMFQLRVRGPPRQPRPVRRWPQLAAHHDQGLRRRLDSNAFSAHVCDFQIPVPLENSTVESLSRQTVHLWTGRDAPHLGDDTGSRERSGSVHSTHRTVVAPGSGPSLTRAILDGETAEHNNVCDNCEQVCLLRLPSVLVSLSRIQPIVGIRYQCATCPSAPASYNLVSSRSTLSNPHSTERAPVLFLRTPVVHRA